jgi:hypothetical protein
MYCPKCSQEQVSDEIRFCSRCGQPLAAIAEALKGGADVRSVTELKRSAMIGFGLVTLCAVFLLATLIIGTPEPSFVVQLNLLVAALVYLSALGYVLYEFLPRRYKGESDMSVSVDEVSRTVTTRNLLDRPEPIVPIDRSFEPGARERVQTSVTEGTTTLLDKH